MLSAMRRLYRHQLPPRLHLRRKQTQRAGSLGSVVDGYPPPPPRTSKAPNPPTSPERSSAHPYPPHCSRVRRNRRAVVIPRIAQRPHPTSTPSTRFWRMPLARKSATGCVFSLYTRPYGRPLHWTPTPLQPNCANLILSRYPNRPTPQTCAKGLGANRGTSPILEKEKQKKLDSVTPTRIYLASSKEIMAWQQGGVSFLPKPSTPGRKEADRRKKREKPMA